MAVLTPLRIALTLPGALSLGAYEAGAVSALVTALQHANSREPGAVRLDVITGASSGALTAVLAARTLLEGMDPVPSLRRAWVAEPSLRALFGRGHAAPLSLERARKVALEELEHEGPPDGAGGQSSPIRLDFALCCLRGLVYTIRRRAKESLQAASYVDWATHVLGPDSASGAWSAATASAITSASHPLAFEARPLDREAERAEYERNGIRNLPERRPLKLWYSDGGLVNNKPLGRCLELVREADDQPGPCATRLVLVLEPDPARCQAPDDPAWAGDMAEVRWTDTLGQALKVIATQSLHEDLRRVEKTNSRIEWTSHLAYTLSTLVRDESEARAQLEKALSTIRSDKAEYGRHRAGAPREDEQEPLTDIVERALRMGTGLEAKRPVNVELVAPDPAEPTEGQGLLLSRGFLAEQLRAHDFVLGYRSMLDYMEDRGRGLAFHSMDRGLAAAACRAARKRGETLMEEDGPRPFRRPSLADSLRLVRLVLRSARIAYLDLRSKRGGA